MQTPPRGRLPARRVPTPQISDRKKRLFENNSDLKILNESIEEQICLLDGIRPLSPDNNLTDVEFNKSVKIMLKKLPTTKMSFLKDKSIDIKMFTKYSETKLPKTVSTPSRQSPCSTISNINTSDIEMPSPRKSNRLQRNTTIANTPENRISSPTTPKNQTNCTDELGKLFKNSLNFKNDKKKSRKEIGSDDSFVMSSTDDDISDYEIEETPHKIRKRVHLHEDDMSKKRQSKIIKLDEDSNNNNKHKSIEDIIISTKTFYSHKEENKTIGNKYLTSPSNRIIKNISTKKFKHYKYPKAEQRLFNKGVSHKIKKPTKQKKISIDDMLKTIRCEKFKFLPSNRLPQDKIDLVHKILAENKNPIEMAKPLNLNINTEDAYLEFSDIENNSSELDSDIEDDNNKKISNVSVKSTNIDVNEKTTCNTTRKFFKSARNTAAKKEITITDNIKATFSNGKIALKKKEKKKKSKMKLFDYSFSAEQIEVNEIIKNLNDSPFKNNSEKINIHSEKENNSNTNNDCLSNNSITNLIKTNDYSEFSKRLPFKTTDPELIEQQRLLLNFLITNNICNEKNFNIFIADPDNHKDEANKICNSLVCLQNDYPENLDEEQIKITDEFEQFRNCIPYKTNDPVKIEEQNLLLDFLIENQICTEDNFKIFIIEPENHKEKAEKIVYSLISIAENNEESINNDKENEKQDDNIQNNMETEIIIDDEDIDQRNQLEMYKNKLFPIFLSGGRKCQPIQQQNSTRNNKSKINLLRSAIGSNQYQIDAGQKEYGAKQCPQCGLVYTVHEPEEEILHNEYHKSIYVLKFRSWIDEDVVANYPEWGNDGRIIRLKSSCSSKKRERLMDVLKIVDKELGFSSYILPSEFVVFLAIRKQQIVGLCLVQFLHTANRYISVNGVDCCTEDTFEARCGISRIWISPLHRRLRIASKLILSVQSHTLTGDLIDLDKIAFSSPTEDGRKFAQKITNRSDFLIYQ